MLHPPKLLIPVDGTFKPSRTVNSSERHKHEKDFFRTKRYSSDGPSSHAAELTEIPSFSPAVYPVPPQFMVRI